MVKISDIPEYKDKENVLTISSDKSVFNAVELMANNNFGSIIISDKGSVIGVFTERDLLKKVSLKSLDLKKTKLKQVMTTKVRIAHPDDEVSDCLRRMNQGRFRHLPIVDSEGNLKGILSQGDLISYSWPQLLHLLSTKTKSSFMTYTQLWMLLIGISSYIILAVIVTKYLIN